MQQLPHDPVMARIWEKVTFAYWQGGTVSRDVPVTDASKVASVHLVDPASNLCLTGFQTPGRALLYATAYGLTDHVVKDLRPGAGKEDPCLLSLSTALAGMVEQAEKLSWCDVRPMDPRPAGQGAQL